MRSLTLLCLGFLLIYGCAYAQKVPVKEVKKIMRAKELSIGEYSGEEIALVKTRLGRKWGLYQIDRFGGVEEFVYTELIPPRYDSLNLFKQGEHFQIVKQDKKYGILISPFENVENAQGTKCIYDHLIHKKVGNEDYVVFQENDKWGLLDWIHHFVIVDPVFENPNDVPLLKVDHYQIDAYQKAKKELVTDYVIFDPINGDGVLKARNRFTDKWGMYQYVGDRSSVLIPSAYDKIEFFPFNGSFTAVYNNSKVGFYLSPWTYGEDARQTVACIYEDYKKYNADGVSKLAVKKDGKWGWVNWITGEEQSEFIYATTDDLPYPYFYQSYEIEN